eukprot:COSAG02_NODE_6930_length_3283_cov_2.564698_1_plen_160_part_10
MAQTDSEGSRNHWELTGAGGRLLFHLFIQLTGAGGRLLFHHTVQLTGEGMAARGAGALRETMTLAQAGDGDGPMCPRAAAIVSGLERQRQEAGRLRGLLQAQTEALLAERGGAAPQPGSEPLDPVSERTAATVSIAKATTEHMLQFVDLAMQKLQAQDDW